MKQRKIKSTLVLCSLLVTFAMSVHAQNEGAPKSSEIGSYKKEGIDVVQGRLFRKGLRHEFSMDVGLIVDNQFLTYELIQPRYTFHLRESIGIELTFGKAFYQRRQILDALANITCETTTGNPPVTTTFPCSASLDNIDPLKQMYFVNFIWSPIYGKFAIFSKKIYHFDLYAIAGAGMFDNENSNRFGINIGLGSKIFMNDWLAIRVDFRNITVREGAPFNQIINNRVYSLGASVFLPSKPRKNT